MACPETDPSGAASRPASQGSDWKASQRWRTEALQLHGSHQIGGSRNDTLRRASGRAATPARHSASQTAANATSTPAAASHKSAHALPLYLLSQQSRQPPRILVSLTMSNWHISRFIHTPGRSSAWERAGEKDAHQRIPSTRRTQAAVIFRRSRTLRAGSSRYFSWSAMGSTLANQ